MNETRLRVIVLGEFSAPIPPLAPHLASIEAEPVRLPSLDPLPERFGPGDLLLTELAWLNRLPADAQADLARHAQSVGGWIALTEAGSRFTELVKWQRLGVRVFFRLPIDPERLAAHIEEIHDQLIGPPIRVLLLDDEASSLAWHGEILRQAGMEVVALQDPLLTLDMIDEQPPDVLVLDIEMPVCRGTELVPILRQQPAHARLPVLFLTAMESMRDKLLARSAAAEDFLAKPVVPELFVTAVRAHARRYRALNREKASNLRQQAKARLRLEQLRLAIDAHAIVSIADAQGRITYVNDKFCTISGYSRAELIGQNHRLLKSGMHEPAFYAEIWRTIGAGRVWHGEICNRRKDGSHYWVAATIYPVVDSRGRPVEYVSIRTDITAVREGEEALRLSEERLRRGQLYANIGTWEWNIETGDLYWSERIAPLFGYAPGKLVTSYENFLNAVHPDDRQAVIDAVNACVEHDAPYEIEHRVVWPDGTVRWLLERGAVTRDAAGQAKKMLGVVQDIDARKRAELALVESEHQLREAQTLAHLGNWVADLVTGELTWSNEIYRIFGHEPGSFTPSIEAFWQAVHPDDLALVHEHERLAAETGHYEVAHRIVRPDGTIRHVQELARAERDETGQVVRLIGTVQDITERIETEQRLIETEKRFAFAVEGAGDGVWDWDMQSGAMALSGNYEGMLGFEKGEIAPTIDAWAASVHPEDMPRVKKTLDDYLAGAIPAYAVELRLACKDGSYKWVLCRGAVVERDAAGQPIRMIGIHSDISARKATEFALIEAREAAERANHAKSEFLSSMSHELRTPMNAIIGFAQMLEYDGSLSEDQQDNVHEILKAGRHLLELINEVLDLAKIEAGRIELSMEDIDLVAVIEECHHLLMPLAQQKGVTLDIAAPAGMALFADRVRLKQILLNLLSNAIKYNRPGGKVSLHAKTLAADRIALYVSDTGQGIPPSRLQQLFEPFNRLGAETSNIEGTGIGLTITRRLVEMMGGAIGVESAPGVGSTFWIELAVTAAGKVGADRTASAQATTVAAPRQERRTVLAIDDNPSNLKLIAQLMGKRPHIHLLTAHTPELGIELALAHSPDLILLDINMPGMDGYQVLEVLKTHASLCTTPVVAVTANAMPGDVERGLAAGFAAYLTKPLDIPFVLATLDRLLSREAQRP